LKNVARGDLLILLNDVCIEIELCMEKGYEGLIGTLFTRVMLGIVLYCNREGGRDQMKSQDDDNTC
jgi:hypothetical protein